MLNIEEARLAIRRFYPDVEKLDVGNPIPYVRTLSIVDMDAFNELMYSAPSLKKIFYGNITWYMTNATGAPVILTINIQNYPNTLDGLDSRNVFTINKIVASTDFCSGITQGIFIQNIFLTEQCSVSLDGYIFGLGLTK